MGDLEISNNFIQPSASSILLSPAQSQVVLHNLSEYQAVSHSLTQSPTDPYILRHSHNIFIQSHTIQSHTLTISHSPNHSHRVPNNLMQSHILSHNPTQSHKIPEHSEE